MTDASPDKAGPAHHPLLGGPTYLAGRDSAERSCERELPGRARSPHKGDGFIDVVVDSIIWRCFATNLIQCS